MVVARANAGEDAKKLDRSEIARGTSNGTPGQFLIKLNI